MLILKCLSESALFCIKVLVTVSSQFVVLLRSGRYLFKKNVKSLRPHNWIFWMVLPCFFWLIGPITCKRSHPGNYVRRNRTNDIASYIRHILLVSQRRWNRCNYQWKRVNMNNEDNSENFTAGFCANNSKLSVSLQRFSFIELHPNITDVRVVLQSWQRQDKLTLEGHQW